MAHQPHVFIVEDDLALRLTLEEKLKSSGFEVTSTGKGNEAAMIAEKILPDVIILDIILPNKSGWEILKEFKGSKSTKDIPVIIVSNFGTESSAMQAKEAGAIEFIMKSNISLEDLLERIKQAIHASKSSVKEIKNSSST